MNDCNFVILGDVGMSINFVRCTMGRPPGVTYPYCCLDFRMDKMVLKGSDFPFFLITINSSSSTRAIPEESYPRYSIRFNPLIKIGTASFFPHSLLYRTWLFFSDVRGDSDDSEEKNDFSNLPVFSPECLAENPLLLVFRFVDHFYRPTIILILVIQSTSINILYKDRVRKVFSFPCEKQGIKISDSTQSPLNSQGTFC